MTLSNWSDCYFEEESNFFDRDPFPFNKEDKDDIIMFGTFQFNINEPNLNCNITILHEEKNSLSSDIKIKNYIEHLLLLFETGSFDSIYKEAVKSNNRLKNLYIKVV